MQFETKKELRNLPIVSVHLEVDNCLLSEIPIRTTKDAINFVAERIYNTAKEVAIALFLDSALCPLCVATVGSGDTANVMFSARDIVQTALLCNASYVTIMHNHPGLDSGIKRCGPSREDVLVTDTIINACNIVGVKLYDSIIASAYKKTVLGMAQPIYYSMREHNYMKIRKKFGITSSDLPNGEEDLIWEFDEDYYTKDGEIPNQQRESRGITYRYMDKKTGKVAEYREK